MFDPRQFRFVQRKPSDRADRTGDPYEAVGVTQGKAPQKACQTRRNRHAREVIIAERWMAGMAGNQDLVVGRALNPILPVRQVPGSQSRVYANLVLSLSHAVQMRFAQAKSPGLPVVRSAV